MGPGEQSPGFREIEMKMKMTDMGEGSMPMDMSDDLAKAKRRMERICATPDEVMLYKCAPNEARDNLRPGIPLEDYGEQLDN